jgi:hypothetical protein
MKKIVFSFLFILFTGGAFAQAVNDAGLWTTLNVDKKLNDKFSLFITEEFRLKENFTMINLFYTDLGVEYRPAKFLKVALSYRAIQKYIYQDQTFSHRHRFMLDITLKKKFDRLSFGWRQRFQREVRNIRTSESGFMPEWYTRSKLTIKYETDGNISPYVAAELRYQFHNPRLVENDGYWHRARYIAGLDYKLNDKNTLGFYYLIQREFNVAAPQNMYIVGLEYSISL